MAKVLVVDDEVMLAELIQEELEDRDFETEVAHNGSEAFEKVQAESFDLVISDIRMPVMTGVEFFKKMKSEIENPVPVIFVSGFSDLTPEKAAEMGAIGLLAKPINYEELFAKVSEVLSKS